MFSRDKRCVERERASIMNYIIVGMFLIAEVIVFLSLKYDTHTTNNKVALIAFGVIAGIVAAQNLIILHFIRK